MPNICPLAMIIIHPCVRTGRSNYWIDPTALALTLQTK